MPIPHLADNTRADSFASKIRMERQQLFIRWMVPEQAKNILDVGGNENAWRMFEFADRVTVLNLSRNEDQTGTCSFVLGNALAMPFPDQSFDLVFSNSVIEHVGSAGDQRRFAQEVRRVGRGYWVQAPNRYFPLEPHFLFPGFQFLPASLRVLVGRVWPYSWAKHYRATQAQISDEARTIRLPSASDLRRCFPEGRLHAEKVFGLTKSLVVYLPPSG